MCAHVYYGSCVKCVFSHLCHSYSVVPYPYFCSVLPRHDYLSEEDSSLMLPDPSSISQHSDMPVGIVPVDCGREEDREEGVVCGSEEDREEGVVCGSGVEVSPLPAQVVERNRLTVAEIRTLPRFVDYSPGIPSRVSVSPLACAVTAPILQ